MKKLILVALFALSPILTTACGDQVTAPSVVTRPIKGSPVSILDGNPTLKPAGSPVSILDSAPR